MPGKVAAFAEFGATLKNVRWSWSAITPDGATVVLQLWSDRFDRATRPISYTEFGNPKLIADKTRPGNRERIKHLKWALDHCGGRFRVVLATAKSQTASTRETAQARAVKGLVMRVTRLQEETGEFRAEVVEGGSELLREDVNDEALPEPPPREATCATREDPSSYILRSNGLFEYVPADDEGEYVPGRGGKTKEDAKALARVLGDWYDYAILDGVDPAKPGIYEWHIDGTGKYVGKYTHINRPKREYQLNIVRLLAGKPYRKNKPEKFRRIHLELANALREGKRPTLTILENPAPDQLNKRERELIRERGSLNGYTKRA